MGVIELLKEILHELKHIHHCLIWMGNQSPEEMENYEHPHGDDLNADE